MVEVEAFHGDNYPEVLRAMADYIATLPDPEFDVVCVNLWHHNEGGIDAVAVVEPGWADEWARKCKAQAAK